MALDFPGAPTDGQQWAAPNGVMYIWSAVQGVWLAQGGSSNSATISSIPPAKPFVGQFWFSPDLGQTFIWYDDGSSQQWVPASPAVVPPTAAPTGSLHLVGENILAAPAAFIQVNYPGNAKLVEVWFDITAAGSTDQLLALRATQGGVPNAGNGVYKSAYDFGYSSNIFVAAVNPSTTFVYLVAGVANGQTARGVVRLTSPAAFGGIANWSSFSFESIFYSGWGSFSSNLSNVDGIYFYSSGNFAAGSYVRTLAVV